MIDGELVILDDDGREVFDALQNRLHPAESRVQMLAEETPALFRAFDLLAAATTALLERPVHASGAPRSSSSSRASTIPDRSSSRRWSPTPPTPSPGSRPARA